MDVLWCGKSVSRALCLNLKGAGARATVKLLLSRLQLLLGHLQNLLTV
jgi:hypothetical protein